MQDAEVTKSLLFMLCIQDNIYCPLFILVVLMWNLEMPWGVQISYLRCRQGGPRLGPPLDIGHNSWAAILIRWVGDGSDDNKIGVIVKKAEYICVFQRNYLLLLSGSSRQRFRFQASSKQWESRAIINHMVKNLFDKWVLWENGFPSRKNIHCTCSGEKQSRDNVSDIVQALWIKEKL